jgi:hypothetical protein
MRLYHFTSTGHLPGILRRGISRGDVPTSPTGGLNAPWLTADSKAGGQGWARGNWKTGVRLTVNVSGSKLRKWSEYAEEEGVDPKWYDALDRAGGGGSDDWYIYLGTIPVSRIEKIEVDGEEVSPDTVVAGEILKLAAGVCGMCFQWANR